MWNGEPPSGREHAIETLLDTEPHSSRIRTARVLEEVVPQALSHRPNLVTRSALIEQAYGLAKYEIDNVQQYDETFGRRRMGEGGSRIVVKTGGRGSISDSANSSKSSLGSSVTTTTQVPTKLFSSRQQQHHEDGDNDDISYIQRNRILNHHKKILAAKRSAATANSGLANNAEVGNMDGNNKKSNVGGGDGRRGSATPLPQLVTALRRIYSSEGVENYYGSGDDGATSLSSSQGSVLKKLLESVLGHPAFAKDAHESSRSTPARMTAQLSGLSSRIDVSASSTVDMPSIDSTIDNPPTTVMKIQTDGDDSIADGGSVHASPEALDFSFAVEAFIAELCNQSISMTKLDSSGLEHGLLIAALSVLTGYATNESRQDEDDVAKRADQQYEEQKEGFLAGKMIGDVDDPKTTPPLQVGSILCLLRTEDGNSAFGGFPFSLDSTAVSYLGKAASIYEERIEIQKARLMKRLENIGVEKDAAGGEAKVLDPAFATPVPNIVSTSSVNQPVVATPQPAGTPVEGSSTTPDAIATEIHHDETNNTSGTALSAAAVLENILAAAVNEGMTSSNEPSGGQDNGGSPSNIDNEFDENQIEDTSGGNDDVDPDSRPDFHQLIDDDDDDSSSSSSDFLSDDAPEDEERDATDEDDAVDIDGEEEETADNEGGELVLRQALALSLLGQEVESFALSRDDGEGVDSSTPEDTPSAPVTPGNATPVSMSESGGGKDEESPLPPIPPPPSRYPLAPSMRSGKPKISDKSEDDDDACYFDPAALSRFGVIDSDYVLVHLLRCLNEKFEGRRFHPSNRISNSCAGGGVKTELSPGGMGSSLFQCTSASKAHLGQSDKTSSILSLQLLSALFLIVVEKRDHAIKNLERTLELENQNDQYKSGIQRPSSGEESEDPAIAMALTYFDEDSSESKDSLKAKGMRRKAAAAAHDAAALLESRRKKTNAWKEQVKLFSHVCLLSMKSIKNFLQTITRNWMYDREGLTVSECSASFPSSTITALSSSLDMLISEYLNTGPSAIFLRQQREKENEGFISLQLYQEAMALWGEAVPILYPSCKAQLDELGLLLTNPVLTTTQKFWSVESLTALPTSEGESLVHRLHVFCRRLRVSDLLDHIVPSPLRYSPDTDDVHKVGNRGYEEPYTPGSTIIDMLMSRTALFSVLKGEPQNLCLSLCHRCHVRILMWDGLLASSDNQPDESPVTAAPLPSGTTLQSMQLSPELVFDSTKCADSMAIIAGKDKSSSMTVHASSVHQRASKVWGTVLSSLSFPPKSGVHRYALRLDKCERGHVFVGVATAQASVRTYVGGDKYGWGAIGTQALWHDRRKIRGDYGATFRTGSVIIVTLDTDAGTLSFSCWKEASTGSPLSLDQGLHSPSNRREAGGIVEDWGVAFEGLPLDAKLFPAVGLYQRDDKVTLLAVETTTSDLGPDGLGDFSGGLGYFPVESLSRDESKTKRKPMSDVRQFNGGLQLDAMKYVKNMLTRIVESVQAGRNDKLVREVLPSLASSLCLMPQSIPILSRRLSLALLPCLSRTILEIDSLVSVDAPLFPCQLQPGKWTVRATGTNSDVEEYVVDFSTIHEGETVIGFKGDGVGTTGKSKNGLVAIFGTTMGSSISFVEEWASDEGFESTPLEMAASSCVVNGRISLDGCSFEGTYRNIQYATSGQIAGRILSSSDLVSKSSLLRLQDERLSPADNLNHHSVAAKGLSLLCLAHSCLSSIICEDGVDDRLYETANRVTEMHTTTDAVELKSLLRLPLFASARKSITHGALTYTLQHLRSTYFDSNEARHYADDLSALFSDSALQESSLLRMDRKGRITTTSADSRNHAVIELDNASTGSLVSLCPSEYKKAKQLVFCALSHHCGILVDELDSDVASSLWRCSLNLLEESLRRSLRADGDRPMRKKAADCCGVICEVSLFLLGFDSPRAEARALPIESITQDISQIFRIIQSRADIDVLSKEMSRSSERALLRLISIDSVRTLLDVSNDKHLQSFNSIESLTTGLPRLLGRGFAQFRRGDSTLKDGWPHYLSSLPGIPSLLHEALTSTVHSLYEIISRIIDSGLLLREKLIETASIDSMILTLLTSLIHDLQGTDVVALVNNSTILSLVPKILRRYESSLSPVKVVDTEESTVSFVQNVYQLIHCETSRGILRVATSLIQLICHKVWTTLPNSPISQACLDMLLGELQNLFSLVTKLVHNSTCDLTSKQMNWQWESFRDNWKKDNQKSSNLQSKNQKGGGTVVEYLLQYGLLQALASSSSPQKNTSSGKSSVSSQRHHSEVSSSQSVSHQYISQWLNILVMASNTEVPCKLIGSDLRWITLLFSPFGVDVQASSDESDPYKINIVESNGSFFPERYRCRLLRSLRPPLRQSKPSSELVRAILFIAGSSCGVLTTRPADEEGAVSREAVSLLRSLHLPLYTEWKSCISGAIEFGLCNQNITIDEINGIICFLNGEIDSLKKGSFVLLKPAAAVPLSSESHLLSSSKLSTSSSLGSSAPHHVVGNGTEGVVWGLCREEASAGIVSNIDIKTNMCEVVLLNRKSTGMTEELRNVLTIRAVRSPTSSVVQAQEIPLLIDKAFPNLAHHLLKKFVQVLFDTRYGPSGLCGEMEGVQTVHLKTREICSATMALKASISLLSDETSVISFCKETESQKLLSLVLQLAYPDDCSSPEKPDFLKDASAKKLSSLPARGTRLVHVMSLFRRLCFESTVLNGTPDDVWESRLEELKNLRASRLSEETNPSTTVSVGEKQLSTPAPKSINEGTITTTSTAQSESAATTRTTSQSTVASETNSEDDENDAAATAARHLREAAIAQMAELGLPRSWSELALRRVGGTNIEAAVHFCLERGGDMERLLAEDRERDRMMQRQSPGAARRIARAEANYLLQSLTDMGFPHRWCVEALNATGNNLDEALTWILTNGERLSAEDEGMEEVNDDEDDDNGGDDDQEDDDDEDSLDDEKGQNLAADKISADLSKNDESFQPCAWSGSIVPLRFISGKSNIDGNTFDISGLPTGGFSSVGTKGVMLCTGKWYYECTLETAGCLQIGWADGSFAGQCNADRGDGCGDGPSSWAYDGWRRYRWHSNATEWGCRWAERDVIGCMVDMDERTVSFTLNGKGEEIGMGVAFSGHGFRPCSGVYACVSFNRREKLRLNLGGQGSAPWKYPPPEGYKGVGEAVLAAVQEREDLVAKEALLDPKHFDIVDKRKPYLCDFSDGEHGFELMSHSHRYYGSDASVHLGSGRIKESSSTSKSAATLHPLDSIPSLCLTRRITEEWKKSNGQLFQTCSSGTEDVDGAQIKSMISKEMNSGLQNVAVKLCIQAAQESLIMSSLLARKLLLHLMVASEENFDPAFIFDTGKHEQGSALRFWRMIETCTNLSSSGWVGEASSMAMAAESLGLGISSNDASSRLSTEDTCGVVDLADLDGEFALPTFGLLQVLSTIREPCVEGKAIHLGSTLASGAEYALGSDAGQGILVFLRKSLRSALCKSAVLKAITVAAVRRSVRQIAVVEYDTEDVTSAESASNENKETKEYTKEEELVEISNVPQPDARLASFFTGLLITCANDVHQSLFEAWSVGMLSASVPWRMICAFTAAGILEQRPDVFSDVLKVPTLRRYFSRLRDTVARRVWAERAASPVASRYLQAILQLLCSVNNAVAMARKDSLPNDFLGRWNRVEVDAATPLPLFQTHDTKMEEGWEVAEGWISSDRGWEMWSGTIHRMTKNWTAPPTSAVRTLMEGGEGPPMLREGCTVIRGPDWDVSQYGNADGKDIYEVEKATLLVEKKKSESTESIQQSATENTNRESTDPTTEPIISDDQARKSDPAPEGSTPPESEFPSENTSDGSVRNPAEDSTSDPASEVPGEDQTNKSTEDSIQSKEKKKTTNPKLPIGVVIGLEAWGDILGMAYRVRWNLTGQEGIYRFGAEGRFDISHVEVNAKMTRVQKRHPLPESNEQCVARHGFGVETTSTILIRLSQATTEGRDKDGNTILHRQGIMEYPEFGAGILIDCQSLPDGSIQLEEKDLLFGSKDSGWEARFGSPSYIPGTRVVLKVSDTAHVHSMDNTKSAHDSLYEKLSGTTSYRVPKLRNRENDGNVEVKSTFHVNRSRSTPTQAESQTLPKHLVEAPIPAILFDKAYHAPSLSISRDGMTLSCISSEGRGTAFANMGFSKGVHYWEVKLESCDIGSVFVGVAEKHNDGSSASSGSYGSPPRLNKWHGFGFVNFRATYTSGAERIYGAHCHAGDIIGVLLDCDGGRLSFFYDGMKYGEHILNDLGVAFENLSPFGYNCDGCGSGGAGQGAPSANEQVGRGIRYPSGSVKPKTLWPVVGLRNHGDRVSFSHKFQSSYGVDGVTIVNNILSTDEIIRAYDRGANSTLPTWFVEEAYDEYRRWQSNTWSKATPRGRGPNSLTTTTFGSDLYLDSSNFACASACALLGMKHALLAGDRVKLKRSAGRILELAEEAVILGSFQGRLYYSIVSQKSEGGSLTEGGGRAWFFDESEVVDGLEVVHRPPKGLNAELPMMDRFTCTSSGGLRIVYEGGAVIRSDIEIFDGSFNLGSISCNTVIPKRDVLQRRVNSSGVVRYLVRYNTLQGWISARIRGGKEEQIVVAVEAENEDKLMQNEGTNKEINDGDEDVHSNVQGPSKTDPISYPTPGLCAEQWLKNFEREKRLRKRDNTSQESESFSPANVDEFASLAAKGIMLDDTGTETDSHLARALSKICDFCDGGNPLDAPFHQVQSAITFAFDLFGPATGQDHERLLNDDELQSISPQAKEAAATSLSLCLKALQNKGNQLPSVDSIMARLAFLRAFNRRLRVALPWMPLRPCQEGSGILGGLYGHGSSTDRAGRSSNKVLRSQWVQVPSIGSFLRKPSIRRMIFTSTKKETIQSIMQVTTTPTPLAHDEYELPREIRTVRINRIRARNIMKSEKTNGNSLISLKRKYSVFSQLQHETRSWGGAGLRRAFVAKGHGGQKRAFKVKLIGEGCNDYSGPYREIFTDSLSEITNTSSDGPSVFGTLGVLDPTPNNVAAVGDQRDLFMFSLNRSDTHACLPPLSPSLSSSEKLIRSSFASLLASRGESSREVEEALVFLGRLVGTALRHGIALDLPLPLETIWKKIVEDEGDEEDELRELDLLSWRNGAHDRKDHMKPALLLWQQRMLNYFVEGLSNVLPVEVFSILTGEELMEMICGNPEIDVDLLRRVVEYEGYEENDHVVQFFWDAVREFTNEERKKFLQFVWARNRLPIKETDFDAPFKIQKDTSNEAPSEDNESGPTALPSASTCFFALSLPPYKTKEELKSKLLFAINNVATMETDFVTQSHEISEGYRSF